ncbi:uncharacterized protein CIMG_09338 [Coccidioides immitis RS]|uniref:Uncharacterized protein n=3 Tax=Coccidioides TaxID=5500 RepID=J3K247_COCIM|nr:uncharacterized protein CIMG_09338 [Coccidioides immitis RS]EAS28134.3 hypothetical protein CIMG_09338 [Coccidioides immitis RS]KMM71960.1 hypothetical protein CPAG_08259 [Coccidioides posadasii RMSCC 3488]KMP08952.1 hypothetical protein CIRG_08633 [Coccidioides immitis RMSCC 2394]
MGGNSLAISKLMRKMVRALAAEERDHEAGRAVSQHRCSRCGKARSSKFHARHPIAPGKHVEAGVCSRRGCTETISSWSKVIAIHIHHHYYYNTNANERRCNGDFTDTILKHDNSILLGSITSGRHLRTVLCCMWCTVCAVHIQ